MKNVVISIVGTQTPEGGDEDVIEFITEGEYTRAGGLTVVTYRESEITGLEGTQTTIEIGRGAVTLIREGTVNSRMEFIEGERHYFAYDTPDGAFTMSVDTSSIMSRLDDTGGDLEIRYRVEMFNAPVSRNSFRINIKEN